MSNVFEITKSNPFGSNDSSISANVINAQSMSKPIQDNLLDMNMSSVFSKQINCVSLDISPIKHFDLKEITGIAKNQNGSNGVALLNKMLQELSNSKPNTDKSYNTARNLRSHIYTPTLEVCLQDLSPKTVYGSTLKQLDKIHSCFTSVENTTSALCEISKQHELMIAKMLKIIIETLNSQGTAIETIENKISNEFPVIINTNFKTLQEQIDGSVKTFTAMNNENKELIAKINTEIKEKIYSVEASISQNTKYLTEEINNKAKVLQSSIENTMKEANAKLESINSKIDEQETTTKKSIVLATENILKKVETEYIAKTTIIYYAHILYDKELQITNSMRTLKYQISRISTQARYTADIFAKVGLKEYKLRLRKSISLCKKHTIKIIRSIADYYGVSLDAILDPSVKQIDDILDPLVKPLDNLSEQPVKPLDNLSEQPVKPLDNLSEPPANPLENISQPPANPLENISESPVKPN